MITSEDLKILYYLVVSKIINFRKKEISYETDRVNWYWSSLNAKDEAFKKSNGYFDLINELRSLEITEKLIKRDIKIKVLIAANWALIIESILVYPWLGLDYFRNALNMLMILLCIKCCMRLRYNWLVWRINERVK